MSFAPHDLSMILSLAGEEPESIVTTGGNYLHQKIAMCHHPSGIPIRPAGAHFRLLAPSFKEPRLVVVGNRKMAVFDDTQPWEDKLLLYPHQIRWENYMPVPTKGDPERVDVPLREPLRSECEHFLHCLSNGEKPRTDGAEGLRVLKILNASQKSLDQQGCKVGLAAAVPKSPTLPFVHPTAVVDNRVNIGAETKIWHFSHILTGFNHW